MPRLGVTLVTFDVDGTLIESIGEDANAMHKNAFIAGMGETFGGHIPEGRLEQGGIDQVEHHGLTDPLVIHKLLDHLTSGALSSGQIADKLDECKQAMLKHVEGLRGGDMGQGITVLPGVKDLLDALKHSGTGGTGGDVLIALVTGNLEPIAWKKMEALGILESFENTLAISGQTASVGRLGGFGSDYCGHDFSKPEHDRAEMLRIAQRRARGLLEERSSGPDSTLELVGHYHVGDTQYDIQAAQLCEGCVPIGVSTGKFSREFLERCGIEGCGDVKVFESLQDAGGFTQFIRPHNEEA